MWIARDERGELNMFTEKPVKLKYDSNGIVYNFFDCSKKGRRYALSRDRFPSITFENSPKELVLKELAEEYGEECYKRGYSDANSFEYGKEEQGNISFDEYVGSKR